MWSFMRTGRASVPGAGLSRPDLRLFSSTVVARARNHLQANYRSVAFRFEFPHPSSWYKTSGGYSEGGNPSLAFSIEGIALAA